MTNTSKPRTSGILLHPTSLPSPYGIGDLGAEAYAFVDFLKESGQHLWQVLPLTHTGYGDSPYQSFSAFAGQPLLINLRHLRDLQLLNDDELNGCPHSDADHVDYGTLIPWKNHLFELAYPRFRESGNWELKENYGKFCEKNQWWLTDYALFMACKKANNGISWLDWEKEYRTPSIEQKEELQHTLEYDMGFYQFLQFMFFDEWFHLKAYANEQGVSIIGDIPIFVSMDSADVWANPQLFQLNEMGYPTGVAGVPPDYFSATGQLWGNPLYKWEAHEEEHYAWWISRIRNQLEVLDYLRIDHFRGFEAYWQVPFGEETAVNGAWIKGPDQALFAAIEQELGKGLPIIAEDLGVITPEVEALRDHFEFPGMKVLQFAFEDTGESSFLPHQYQHPNCVCYTGTHDNDTTAGWFDTLRPECRSKVCRYMNLDENKSTEAGTLHRDISLAFIKTALASIATYAVFPMQDVLGVGKEGRMNCPGVSSGNWSWRYRDGSLNSELAQTLREMSQLYGRY